ncbi:sulfotransferase 1C2-like isoform X2 [Ornithodoros turicata]
MSTQDDPDTFCVRGLKLSKEFTKELVESALQYTPQDDDIFVVSYSKCGASFVQHIVHLLFHEGNPSADYIQWSLATPHLELVGAAGVRKMPRPNAIKSHFPVNYMPWSKEAKYIYVARNPKDCFVSIFFNRQLFLRQKSMDRAFEEFISGNMIWGDYFEHLRGWYEKRDEPNVLFILYEDIKRSPHEIIEKLAAFMGDRWHNMLAADDSILDKIVHHSSYDFMKVHASRTVKKYEEAPDEDTIDVIPVEMPARRTRTFARRGTVGDWRTTLNAEQEAELERALRDKSKGTALYKLWRDLDEDDDSDF